MPSQAASYAIDQVVRCFDLDGAEAFERLLSCRLAPSQVIARTTADTIRVSGAYGAHEGVEFSRTQCVGELVITPRRPFDGVIFFAPLAGRVVIRDGDNVRIGTDVSAICTEGAACQSVELAGDATYYSVAIRYSHFVERLAALLGRPIVQRPTFQPIVDRSFVRLRMLMALVDFATGPSFGPSLLEGALAAKRLNDMLVDLVLEIWPHSYSELLLRPAAAIAPRHVRLAVDFITEHPAADVDSAQLAALGGVSVRALQAGFRRFAGTSIVAYQRHVRLEHARDELIENPMHSVEDIARNWGFTNAGRFSRYFREVYGTSPAQVRETVR